MIKWKKKRDLQESKLQQLENSVEGEEMKWQDKAEALTVELQQVRGQGHGPVNNKQVKGQTVTVFTTCTDEVQLKV